MKDRRLKMDHITLGVLLSGALAGGYVAGGLAGNEAVRH